MSNLVIPLPRGLKWDIKKKSNWSTIIQRGYSGREVRSPLYANPIWDWEMSWDYLYDYANPALTDEDPPTIPICSAVTTNPLPAATYYVVATYVYAEGETFSSPEATQACAAGECLSVASPTDPGDGPLGWNAYVGLWSGGEVIQNTTLLPIGTDWVETNLGLTSNPNAPSHIDQTQEGFVGPVAAPPQEAETSLLVPPLQSDWERLIGFYGARQGAYDYFYFADPTDGYVFNSIGIGDGTTKQFQLVRKWGDYAEVVQAPLGPLIISFGNSQQNTGYTMSATGLITFGTAPPATTPINAFCSFFYPVRFQDDNLEGNNFMYNLMKLQKLGLRSVKL